MCVCVCLLSQHIDNEIYSWVGWKTFIHPYIDEGKGISLERNQEFNNSGRILMANNIAYWNGYAGINNHDGYNVDMIGNTAYMNSYTNSITYANRSDRSGNNVGISINGGENCTMINNIAVIDTSDPSWVGKALSIAGITGTLKVSSNIIYGYGNASSIQEDEDLDGIEENTIEYDPMFDRYLAYTDAGIDNGDAFMLKNSDSRSIAIGAGNYGFEPCEDVFTKERINNTIGAVGVGMDNIDISNISYLDECYSWIRNVTVDDTNDDDGGEFISVIRFLTIADGFIQEKEDVFKGDLDYLDVKSPSGSIDFKLAHIRFNGISEEIFENMTDCDINSGDDVIDILNVSLVLRSTGYDNDLSNNLMLYGVFEDDSSSSSGSSSNKWNWTETQNINITNNVPRINDSQALIGEIAIDLVIDGFIAIPLNITLLNEYNYTSVDTFEIIVTSTVGSRVLQFYSRESGVNNTAYIEMMIKCFSNDYTTTTTTTTTTSTTTMSATTQSTMDNEATASTSTSNINTLDDIVSTNVSSTMLAPSASPVEYVSVTMMAPSSSPVDNQSGHVQTRLNQYYFVLYFCFVMIIFMCSNHVVMF